MMAVFENLRRPLRRNGYIACASPFRGAICEWPSLMLLGNRAVGFKRRVG